MNESLSCAALRQSLVALFIVDMFLLPSTTTRIRVETEAQQ